MPLAPRRFGTKRAMIFFFAMLAASTVLMIRSVSRMLRSRFLGTADLAILSTWYYAVPLAFFAFIKLNPRGRIFLHSAAANPSIAVESMQYVVLAMIALLVGQAIGRFMGPAKLTSFFSTDHAGETRAWTAFAVLVAMTGFGILQFGVGEFFQGYSTESDLEGATLGIILVYFAVGSFGIIIAYALLLYRATLKRSLLYLIAFSVIAALAVLLIRSKRLEVVITLLPVVIILLSTRKSYKAATSRLIIGALALVGLVAISIVRVGDEFDPFTLSFYFLSEGLYAGHSLPGLIARADSNMIDYEWGGRFLSAVLGFVPRFLWPDKDAIVYAGNLALEDLSPLGATSMLAETVLQGGIAAVLIFYTLMGIAFERASRFEVDWDRAISNGVIPTRFIAYLVLTTTFVPHFRDGIIPAIKLSLQAGVFMSILVRISNQKTSGIARPGFNT